MPRKRFIFSFITLWLSLFVICTANAEVSFLNLSNQQPSNVELYLVRPTKSHFKYLIPVKTNQSLQQALALYKQSLLKNPDLAKEVSAETLNQFNLGTAQKISDLETSSTRVLILANREYDLAPPPQEMGFARMARLDEKIDNAIEKVILPVAVAINLNIQEKNDFYRQIAHAFQGVIAVGGADIDPSHYSEKLTHSREVNYSRDYHELDFLKFWIQKTQGFLFGICRGHQLIATALGYKLNQHIDHHGDGQWLKHKVYVQNTKSPNIFNRIFNAQMQSFSVLSYHHQAVLFDPTINPNIEVAARAQDNTVESLMSRDGRIFTTQFHPEFMSDYISKKIFSFLGQKIKSSAITVQNKCLRLF